MFTVLPCSLPICVICPAWGYSCRPLPCWPQPARLPPDAALSQARTALARLPLRFEANRGQWDPAVRYAARANGYALLLTAAGPVVAFPGSQRVAIRLLDSNPAAPIEALDPLPSHTDYFLGSRDHWHTGIPNYSRVRYGAVYPGIDVVYYGNPSRLEYDFVLQPGADPRAIRLKFRGAGHLRITAEGDLAFESAGTRHGAREARDLSTGRADRGAPPGPGALRADGARRGGDPPRAL